MAVAYVRDTGEVISDAVATMALSFGTLPAAGNLIVVPHNGWHSSNYTVTSVSDNQGNGNYTSIGTGVAYSGAATRAYQHYKENIGSPSGTFTVTVDPVQAADNYTAGVAIEYSGAATSSVLRDSGTNSGNNTSTDASVTSAGSSAQVGDGVVVNALVVISGDTNVTWGAAATTGYNNRAQEANWTAHMTISADEKIASGSGSQSANWSHDATSGASNGWAAIMGVYAQAAAGDANARLIGGDLLQTNLMGRLLN